MFPKSTQAQFWMFENEGDLNILRSKTNVAYIERYGYSSSIMLTTQITVFLAIKMRLQQELVMDTS